MRYIIVSILLIVVLLAGCASQKALYEESMAINTIEAYKNFLRKYPTGEMAVQIRQKLEILEYNKALKINTVAHYEWFLREYSTSEFCTKIEEQLLKLRNEIAFLEAIAAKDFHTGEQLLGKSVDINCADKNGFTALHHASQHGDMKTVTFLLDKGADVNAEAMLGETPYLLADNDVMAEYLLQKGAQKIDETRFGVTPAMMAARYGRIDRLKALIKKGADVNATDLQGISVMHWAIGPESKTNVLGILLDSGALINIEDADGQTPLIYALKNGNSDAFKFLLDKGARFDLHTETGFAYFNQAIDNKNHEMVDYILSSGDVRLPEELNSDFYVKTWNYLSELSNGKTAEQQLEMLDPWLLNVDYRLNSFEEKIFLTELFSWAAILHGRNNQNARAAISNLTASAVIHTTFKDMRDYFFKDILSGLDGGSYGLFQSLQRLEAKKVEIEKGTQNIRKTRKFLHSLGVASLYLGTFDFMKALAETQSDDKEKSEEALKSATEKVTQLIGAEDPYKKRCTSVLNDLFTVDKDCWPSLQALNLFPDKHPLKNIVLMPRFYDYEHNIEEYLDKYKDESVELAQKWLNSSSSTGMQKDRAYFILGYHKVKHQPEQTEQVERVDTTTAPTKIEVPTTMGNRTVSLDVSKRRESEKKSSKAAGITEQAKPKSSSATKTESFDKYDNIFYDYYCLRLGLDDKKTRMDHLIEATAEENRIALVLYNKVRGDSRVPLNLVDWLLKEIRKEKYSDNDANHIFIPLIEGLAEAQKVTVVNEMYNAYNFEWKDVASVYYKNMIPEDISKGDIILVLQGSVPWKKVTLMNTIMERDSTKYLDLIQRYLSGEFYTAGDSEIIRRNLKNMFTKDLNLGYNQQINWSAVNRAVEKIEPRYKAMLILAVADGLDLLEVGQSLNIIKTGFLTDDHLCVKGAQWILENYNPEEHGSINFETINTTSKTQQAVIELLNSHYAPAPDYADYVNKVDGLKNEDQWSDLVNLGVKYGEKDLFKQADEAANLANPVNDMTLDILMNNIKNRYMTILSEAK